MAFEFYCVPRIVFGIGAFLRAAELARPLGGVALVIFNGSADIAERLKADLDKGSIRTSLHRQRGEPTVADVDGAVEAARSLGAQMTIGLGGGSAIDAAKAVAALLTNGGSATDYMEVVGKGQKITQPAAPWIAIPTTAGTGAEATRNAVIGLPEKKFKASIRSELILPRIALVDPELGIDVPPRVTACSGMDALCQLIESYTSSGANPMTDALAVRGIPLGARALLRAYADGNDLTARSDMALAALWSGMTLTNAGLGAVHGFAAPLGANFPAPHGAICAALLAPVMSANVEALRAQGDEPKVVESLRRYAAIGRLLGADPGADDWHAIEFGIRTIQSLVKQLNIPPLSQFQVTATEVPAMVALAKKASSMRYNPIMLSDEALARVLTAAL